MGPMTFIPRHLSLYNHLCLEYLGHKEGWAGAKLTWF